MPTLERVQAFIQRVEMHDFSGAVAHFYHDDVLVQENFGDIRQGRDALLAHEVDLIARYGKTPVRKVENFAVNGDLVFINWVFDLSKGGEPRTFDEVTMQRWRGDRVAFERFYYDPAQLR
ncbi:MAG TPA: nuclear transport factor 2 family protein [Hyphomonadaceae bacterium]|nr:nuclear transport factor 2 family protein [Hyphomonadaceae bacterium]